MGSCTSWGTTITTRPRRGACTSASRPSSPPAAADPSPPASGKGFYREEAVSSAGFAGATCSGGGLGGGRRGPLQTKVRLRGAHRPAKRGEIDAPEPVGG